MRENLIRYYLRDICPMEEYTDRVDTVNAYGELDLTFMILGSLGINFSFAI
jgi:hypothetical protein